MKNLNLGTKVQISGHENFFPKLFSPETSSQITNHFKHTPIKQNINKNFIATCKSILLQTFTLFEASQNQVITLLVHLCNMLNNIPMLSHSQSVRYNIQLWLLGPVLLASLSVELLDRRN